MSLNATIRARCDADLKDTAEAIFKELGITTSQAINMFLAKVKIEKGMPFELKIPNETTQLAMNEAKEGIGMEAVTLDDLKAEFETAKHAKR
ncbi:MAG: type II toxin-antitoxin system RelB/DinJ family antitoxin [Sulfuricurvum sp.]|nr:type II toxin-antitoxin system RelB/DinJ family antitoxin [Sulfuricurvum sp.]